MILKYNIYGSRADFLIELKEKLGNIFDHFDALNSLGKSFLS